MTISTNDTLEVEQGSKADIIFSGKRLRDYLFQEENHGGSREAIGRVFVGHDESLNVRAIYTQRAVL